MMRFKCVILPTLERALQNPPELLSMSNSLSIIKCQVYNNIFWSSLVSILVWSTMI